MIPAEFLVVVEDNLRPIFIVRRIWVFKKVKHCQQFLMENVGDLVMSMFVRVLGYFRTWDNHMFGSYRGRATKTCVRYDVWVLDVLTRHVFKV